MLLWAPSTAPAWFSVLSWGFSRRVGASVSPFPSRFVGAWVLCVPGWGGGPFSPLRLPGVLCGSLLPSPSLLRPVASVGGWVPHNIDILIYIFHYITSSFNITFHYISLLWASFLSCPRPQQLNQTKFDEDLYDH